MFLNQAWRNLFRSQIAINVFYKSLTPTDMTLSQANILATSPIALANAVAAKVIARAFASVVNKNTPNRRNDSGVIRFPVNVLQMAPPNF